MVTCKKTVKARHRRHFARRAACVSRSASNARSKCSTMPACLLRQNDCQSDWSMSRYDRFSPAPPPVALQRATSQSDTLIQLSGFQHPRIGSHILKACKCPHAGGSKTAQLAPQHGHPLSTQAHTEEVPPCPSASMLSTETCQAYQPLPAPDHFITTACTLTLLNPLSHGPTVQPHGLG